MAEAKSSAVPVGMKFEKLEAARMVSRSANRDEAALTVSPTGHSKSNTETKDRVMELVEEARVNQEKFRFAYGVNREAGIIALYVADWDTIGAMPVRVTPNSISFHLAPVFEKYPSLRPATKVEPEIGVTTDADGKRCIAFNILAALPKQKSRRSSKNQTQTADNKPTPAKQEPPK